MCRRMLEISHFNKGTKLDVAPELIFLGPSQSWQMGAAAAVPYVLIFHSCANFCLFVFHAVFKVFFLFCAILGFLHDFEHFSHIFCVLIFQAQSFASAIF